MTNGNYYAGKLWISYFEEGSTVPPPFNVIPTPKSFFRFFFCQTKKKKKYTQAQKEDAEDRYLGLDIPLQCSTVKTLIKRKIGRALFSLIGSFLLLGVFLRYRMK